MDNIIITGASKGIGRAIALKFALQGFGIAACARNEQDLKKLEAEVNAIAPHNASKHIFLTCDMSDRDQVYGFAKKINAQWRSVKILVNNAGVFIPGQVISEAEGTLEKLINTNLYSAYHMSRAIVPAMLAEGGGHIFNMCSVASLRAYPDGGSYSISKFAMLGLSKALREELKASQIKVTSLMPGATLTDSWAGVDLPQSRFMRSEDIAQLILDVYNLSDRSVIEEIVLRPMAGDI